MIFLIIVNNIEGAHHHNDNNGNDDHALCSVGYKNKTNKKQLKWKILVYCTNLYISLFYNVDRAHFEQKKNHCDIISFFPLVFPFWKKHINPFLFLSFLLYLFISFFFFLLMIYKKTKKHSDPVQTIWFQFLLPKTTYFILNRMS